MAWRRGPGPTTRDLHRQGVRHRGGRGYSNLNLVERYLRDIKGLQIYAGTAHIQRLVIARDMIGKETLP